MDAAAHLPPPSADVPEHLARLREILKEAAADFGPITTLDSHRARLCLVRKIFGACEARIGMALRAHAESRTTVAISVCDCGQYIRAEPWTGPRSHEGKPYVESHGLCDACAIARMPTPSDHTREIAEAFGRLQSADLDEPTLTAIESRVGKFDTHGEDMEAFLDCPYDFAIEVIDEREDAHQRAIDEDNDWKRTHAREDAA